MAKLFVLLKIKDASGIGWLQSYAGYGAYTVSSILDEYQDARLDLQKLNADVLTHAQAKSAIFADAYRGYINLKLGTSIAEDFPEVVVTEDAPKARYDMTDADFFSPILAKQKGILIQTCPNVVTRNVAESTICEITLHAKQRHLSYAADQNCLKTMQLYGKTAGIIGNGNIGKAVGKVLSAMGMTVLYNDITESKAATSIERIFKESAVISIHIPAIQKGSNKSNIGFIDSKLLDLCKGAILINLSTDIIVDSASLISALNAEKIIGYSVESGRKVTDKLKKYKQVHLAPCSFDSDEARKTVRSRWIQNTISLIKGTPENIWAELKKD